MELPAHRYFIESVAKPIVMQISPHLPPKVHPDDGVRRHLYWESHARMEIVQHLPSRNDIYRNFTNAMEASSLDRPFFETVTFFRRYLTPEALIRTVLMDAIIEWVVEMLDRMWWSLATLDDDHPATLEEQLDMDCNAPYRD